MTAPTSRERLARRGVIGGGIAGVVGLVGWGIGLAIEPRQALVSYVFAFATLFTIVLGAIIQVMISHVSGARWFTTLRRLTLGVAGAMPAVVVLAVPIFVGVHLIYPWATPAALPPEARAVIARKQAWLDVPFFIARGVFYLATWIAAGVALRRWSLRQDLAPPAAVATPTRWMRRVSAVGLVVLGLTLTFAAFDWLMSLEPTWYSTVYGVYVFAGGFLAALALIAVLGYIESRHGGALDGVVTPEHFGALGKLLLTFVIFWGYIAFSQFLIIWIGDVPADVSWYVARASGSWGTLALVVAVGQFAIPTVALLSRPSKRSPRLLAALGIWLLVMHVLDVYWLVLPALHPAGIRVSWLDLATLLMTLGFAAAVASWRASRHALLPVHDPYIEVAIRYSEP